MLVSRLSPKSNQPAGSLPFRPQTAGGDTYQSSKLSRVRIIAEKTRRQSRAGDSLSVETKEKGKMLEVSAIE